MSYLSRGGFLKAALICFWALAPYSASGVEGLEDQEPPVPSETTTTCDEGTVWDDTSESCVPADAIEADQASLYGIARELAWAGRLDDARAVLDRMEESDKRLTYLGFVERRAGNWQRAEVAYQMAISRNPGNLLARSYYGQGLVSEGDYVGARAQLTEIRLRGGRVSWPELALRLSLESGSSQY